MCEACVLMQGVRTSFELCWAPPLGEDDFENFFNNKVQQPLNDDFWDGTGVERVDSSGVEWSGLELKLWLMILLLRQTALLLLSIRWWTYFYNREGGWRNLSSAAHPLAKMIRKTFKQQNPTITWYWFLEWSWSGEGGLHWSGVGGVEAFANDVPFTLKCFAFLLHLLMKWISYHCEGAHISFDVRCWANFELCCATPWRI